MLADGAATAESAANEPLIVAVVDGHAILGRELVTHCVRPSKVVLATQLSPLVNERLDGGDIDVGRVARPADVPAALPTPTARPAITTPTPTATTGVSAAAPAAAIAIIVREAILTCVPTSTVVATAVATAT